MPENVQYETTSPSERIPMSAPNMRSTLSVPPDGAIRTIAAMVRKDLREQQQHPGSTYPEAG
jgi:hypothetical protein